MAEAPCIAYMDDDAVADKGWLAALLAAFTSAIGSACGRGRTVRSGARPAEMAADRCLGMLSMVDWGGSLREPASAMVRRHQHRVPVDNTWLGLGGFRHAPGAHRLGVAVEQRGVAAARGDPHQASIAYQPTHSSTIFATASPASGVVPQRMAGRR